MQKFQLYLIACIIRPTPKTFGISFRCATLSFGGIFKPATIICTRRHIETFLILFNERRMNARGIFWKSFFLKLRKKTLIISSLRTWLLRTKSMFPFLVLESIFFLWLHIEFLCRIVRLSKKISIVFWWKDFWLSTWKRDLIFTIKLSNNNGY